MANPKKILIKESIIELQILQNKLSPILAKRIEALIVFKMHEKDGISKRELAKKINANHNSIQKWRQQYISGGLKLLLDYQKPKGRTKLLSDEEQQKICDRINNRTKPIKNFKELQDWIFLEFNKSISISFLIKRYPIFGNNFLNETKVKNSKLSKEMKINFLKKTWNKNDLNKTKIS